MTPASTSPDIRARIPQGVQRDVAADEVARELLGDVESGPAVTTADFQEAAAGGRGQGVAQRVCLFDGRESVQADFMAEDDALNPPRHLASALGVPLPEAVDRVRLRHSSMISTEADGSAFFIGQILPVFSLFSPCSPMLVREARRRTSGEFPSTEPNHGLRIHYVIQRDMYGQKIAPENLGSVESVSFFGLATRFPADMVASVERNLVVRDGWAAGYFHPFLYADDPTLLEELVTGIRALGFTFVPLSKDMQ